MTLNIQFPPQTAERLKQHASESGKDIEQIVREAVEEKLSISVGAQRGAESLTPQQRLALWEQWVASHPVRTGVHLDDSRESIYAGRGE
jgi:hypothetical protein